MRATLSIAWLLLRGGGRRDLGTQALGAAAFAVSTGLLLITLGFNVGFAHRADRVAWTVPVAASPTSAGRAVQSTRTDFYNGRTITVVTLGRPVGASGRPPVPPGLTAFPGPGQQWLSPALAALVRSDPGALQHRWPGSTAGTIATAGLATPDQLLVVLGADPAAPLLHGPAVHDLTGVLTAEAPATIEGFSNRPGPDADQKYRDLSRIASILLIVPLLVLGGAAARLGLARRDHRLATVRLVGGRSSQLLIMVALEAAGTAAVGALTGTLLYLGLLPLAARVPFDGGTWFWSDLWVGGGVLTAVLGAVILGGIGSAITTLRRVVVTPLGVSQRHRSSERHLWRALVFAGVLGGYLVMSHGHDPALATMTIAFGMVFGALSLLGPWVMVTLGQIMVAGARGPARLLAGQRILHEPKAAWRTVGGMALTGFIAGFLVLFPTANQQPTGAAGAIGDVIKVAVPAARAASDHARAEQSLRAAGLTQPVSRGSDAGALLTTTVGSSTTRTTTLTAYLTVAITAQNRERTRTALHRALPGLPAVTSSDIGLPDRQLFADVQRASTAVLIASFLVAIASTGITACAGVLDRRRTFQLLHLAGMPLRLLDDARRQETTAPLLILLGGSLATGLICSAPITKLGFGGAGQLDVTGLTRLAGTVVIGVLGLRLASAASAPLLRAVATDTSSRPD
jgi:hypothetical protein